MATVGTRLMTWLRGKRVGRDEFGNRYYCGRRRAGHKLERRWVIYRGADEASAVPAEWHAWLHHISDELPLAESPRRRWQKEHLPNQTGTKAAYRPQGSVLAGGRRAKATGDYEPWTPP
ncbi:MAG: NADH:ubiquinone oxidoreductase subunit NDUFA12 [Alphaproteobacteria bacterium]